MSLADLKDALGDVRESQLRYSLNVLKDANRVHISGWQEVNKVYRQFIPVWSFGAGRSVPPPEAPHTTLKRGVEVHPLDFNPGADLQAVTVIWGHMTMRGE
jgi:hypothetical protein